MKGPFVLLGRAVLSTLSQVGAVGRVLGRTLRSARKLWVRELLRSLYQFGVRSLPQVLLVAVLIGAIVVVQTALYVDRFGARMYVGWAASYAVLWEFGPLLLSLVVAARVGARNAAELASLKLGGQMEGLRAISLDPYALLIGPRILAIVLSMTLLAPPVFGVAILCEAVSAKLTLQVPPRVFGASVDLLLSGVDVLGAMTKTVIFGLAIALVSTVAGISAEGGARSVGRAASRAMVVSCASIFFLDFLLTAAFSRALR